MWCAVVFLVATTACRMVSPPQRLPHPHYLIFGHYSINALNGAMSTPKDMAAFRQEKTAIKHFAKVLTYPCGIQDILASTSPDFGPKGWEAAGFHAYSGKAKPKPEAGDRARTEAQPEDIARSQRRAKAQLRRMALATEFKYFVTLTLDPSKVDSHDGNAVVKKLNAWCSNAVQRDGLAYILVPERHKKGGIHFHGFFNDALPAVDSGTMRLPWAKKPRKPRSKAEREEWLAAGGRIVYNLPNWTLGFTTAMELYGDYPAAVAYVCKYIGKDGEKPAGRWYYSGGKLGKPVETYAELSPAELAAAFPEQVFVFNPPGKQMAVVNGVVLEQVQKGKDDGTGRD